FLLLISLPIVGLVRVTLNAQYIGNRVGSTSSPLSCGVIWTTLMVTLSSSFNLEEISAAALNPAFTNEWAPDSITSASRISPILGSPTFGWLGIRRGGSIPEN